MFENSTYLSPLSFFYNNRRIFKFDIIKWQSGRRQQASVLSIVFIQKIFFVLNCEKFFESLHYLLLLKKCTVVIFYSYFSVFEKDDSTIASLLDSGYNRVSNSNGFYVYLEKMNLKLNWQMHKLIIFYYYFATSSLIICDDFITRYTQNLSIQGKRNQPMFLTYNNFHNFAIST